jgi:hypothetical protein
LSVGWKSNRATIGDALAQLQGQKKRVIGDQS